MYFLDLWFHWLSRFIETGVAQKGLAVLWGKGGRLDGDHKVNLGPVDFEFPK